MKKIVVFIFIFTLIRISSFGQFNTPGSGISWNLDDLVSNSNGTVTLTDNVYFLNENLTIISPDTIKMEENTILRFAGEALITVQGVLLVNPPDSILFTAIDTLETYKSFRFEDSDASVLKNCIMEFGGGLDILNSDLLIMNSIFSKNDKSNSTGVVDLFFSNPEIKNCSFYENQGPAVMSGANSESSPLIRDNLIYRNNTVNSNMPQINLGTSSPGLPIRILNNTIEGYYDKAGGIAVTTLAGGELDCIIDSNLIYNNRYGITAYGFDITSIISNNKIYDNNIENIPMQGGSGINYWGGTSNTSLVFGNEIYGNLWGITITGDAQANLGQVDPDTLNTGENSLFDNGNLGTVYALYNNTPNDIYAENNYWGSYNLDSVEMVIFHYPDDETLGIVDYLPIMDSLITHVTKNINKQVLSVFPNPAESYIIIRRPSVFINKTGLKVLILDAKGQLINHMEMNNQTLKFDISGLKPGLYFVKISHQNQIVTSKIIKY